jgi:cell wall-associated NlpC family hydrolase
MIDAVQAAQNRADSASKAARDLVAVATAKLDALSHQRAVLQKQIDNYTSMLASLSFNQRVAYQQAVTPSLNDAEAKALLARLASVPATNKAMIAVKFALAQVGKPYVYATAGPDTYDCSGLTMAAWRAAGVSLPHSSEEQFNMGTAVPLADIQPGDLLFYYGPPPGHVTIYVGGGLMVSAPEPGEDVKVVKVSDYANDYVGARRVG